MYEPRDHYRMVRWPNDRRGIRPMEAAELIGVRTRNVYELLDQGVFVMWRNTTTWGIWIDADEVASYVAARTELPPEDLAG